MKLFTFVTQAVVSVCLLSATGCTSVAKRAFYEFRGAQGTLTFITEPAAEDLDGCGAVAFEPAATTLGPRICPPELLPGYNAAAQSLAAELAEHYPGDEPTLTIASDIIYFRKKGLLGDAELIVRVRLRKNGEQVGDGLLVVNSKAFREGGADDLSAAAIKALGKFLRRENRGQD